MYASERDLEDCYAKQERIDYLCDANSDNIAERAQELHDLDPSSSYDDCLALAESEFIRAYKRGEQ